MKGSAFRVVDLGLRDYRKVWTLQKELVRRRSAGKIPDTLLLVEHSPVYTVGRGLRKDSQDIPSSIPVYEVERGGGVTYHGPGQLAGYPILHLQEKNLKISDYFRLLEEVILQTLAAFDISGNRIRGFRGVWVEKKKIASIGIAVSQGIAYHGFALNVNPDLDFFEKICPCGLQPSSMTSMEKILNGSPSMAAVRQELSSTFRSTF
ncbi:MAG: lipoyl(octanoyl) transferase LipB [Elusimicrobia bacterium]|nr:lipoyl(octanoyl) transferase LipB [Elusimicrobiota bacterium]